MAATGAGGSGGCMTNVECDPMTPYCDTDNGTCVECLDASHCSNEQCKLGVCEPLTSQDLVLWLRGSDLSAMQDGALVSAWNDQSSAINHALGTGDRRPKVVLKAFGDHPGVSFDGVDDQLILTTNPSKDELSIVALIRASSDGHVIGTGSSSTSYLTSYGCGLVVKDMRAFVKSVTNNNGVKLTTPVNHLVADYPTVIATTLSATGSKLSVADVAHAQVAEVPNFHPYVGASLGASDGGQKGNAIDPFKGMIAELLVYQRALSAGELAEVTTYLSEKHQVSAPPPFDTLNLDARVFYKMDESGDGPRVDIKSGMNIDPWEKTGPATYDQNGNGTLPVAAIIGDGQHVMGKDGYHFSRKDASPLNHGGGSFTWAGWVSIDALDPNDPYLDNQTFVAKWNVSGGTEREYNVVFERASLKWKFLVSHTGSQIDAFAIHPTVITADKFYLLEAWHDADAGEIGLRVSDDIMLGQAVTSVWQLGVNDSAADLNVGASNTCADSHLQGIIDGVGYWPRVLTKVERQKLHEGIELLP